MATKDTCGIFGCLNEKAYPEIVVSTTVGDATVCTEHYNFFTLTDPDSYRIGLTYRNEIEVRPVPATPVEE